MDRYSKMFKDALAAGKKRDYKKAVKLLLQLLSETDQFPEALLYLGRSYHCLEQYYEAIHYMRLYLKQDRESGAACFFIGRSYLALDKPEKAFLFLSRASQLIGENAALYSMLGTCYLKMRAFSKALESFEKAVHLEPQNIKVYQAYINSLLVQGIRLFHKADYEMSRQIFEFLQENMEEQFFPQLYLALIYKNRQEYKKALYHLNQALAYNPDDRFLLYQRIFLLSQLGMQQELQVQIKQCPELKKEDRELIQDPVLSSILLAITSFKNGKFTRAIHYAKKWVREYKPDAEAFIILGQSYKELDNLEVAERYLLRAQKIQPDSRPIHYALIGVYWEMEEYEKILGQLRRIEKNEADNPHLGYYRVLCKCQLGHSPQETVPLLQKQIRTHGPDLFLMRELGLAFLSATYYKEAETWFKKVLKVEEEDEEALLGLLRIYLALDKKGLAEKYYKSYFEYYEDRDLQVEYIQFLVKNQKWRQAKNEILKEQSYSRKSKEASRLLALCYRHTEDYHNAVIAYKEYLKTDPFNIPAIKALIYCLEKNNQRQVAIKIFDSLPAKIREEAELSLIYGVLLVKAEKNEKALELFREMLANHPGDWRVHHNLSVIYKQMGDQGMAQKFFDHCQKYKDKALKNK